MSRWNRYTVSLDGFDTATGEHKKSMERLKTLFEKLLSVEDFLCGDDVIRQVPEGEPGGRPVYIPGLSITLARHYYEDYNKKRDAQRKPLKDGELVMYKPMVTTNAWYSEKQNAIISITKNIATGDVISFNKSRFSNEDKYEILDRTTMAVAAWTIDAEDKALDKLQELIGEEKFKTYFLTGMIWEHSSRSNVNYIIRKGRPTLAFSQKRKFLAALCMHPMGYYSGSFAGVFVPTDDVIAHLLLVRGDEHRLWKKSTHHTANLPNAGY